ncbi:MAG: LacI family DNA-binding transcriptional regulator [Actinomycetota bacterium]|nr:LacI family DNA-binding transcriptional regulator [Actinomycetota bacterium]
MYSKEIAKLAGVSRSTVSRVINNYSNVTPKTKEKVNKVIKKYGYIPHAPARALAGKNSKIIGVFLTNIKARNRKFRVFQNVYTSPFEAAIIDYADKLGYNVLVLIINNNNDFDKIRDLFSSRILSGGIFIGANNDSPKIFKLIKKGYKITIIDQEKNEKNVGVNYIIVNSDNFNGAYKAAKHLIDYGHKEIAHICGDMNKYSGFKRLEGYIKAMEDAKLKIKEGYMAYGDFNEDGGFKSAEELLKGNNKITAIFSSNDSMAIGAMKAIKKMGLRIPEDISIVGYDDVRSASYISPALTTIRSSIFEMAFIATGKLVNYIENDVNSTEYYTIPAELIIRESTRKLE